jgi:hypothetical protein
LSGDQEGIEAREWRRRLEERIGRVFVGKQGLSAGLTGSILLPLNTSEPTTRGTNPSLKKLLSLLLLTGNIALI